MHDGRDNLIPGNTKNVGRKPNRVRELMIEGIEKAAPNIIKIACGEAVMTVQATGPGGKVKRRILKPTFAEQNVAFDLLCKYGAGVVKDTESEAGKGSERVVFSFD